MEKIDLRNMSEQGRHAIRLRAVYMHKQGKKNYENSIILRSE